MAAIFAFHTDKAVLLIIVYGIEGEVYWEAENEGAEEVDY